MSFFSSVQCAGLDADVAFRLTAQNLQLWAAVQGVKGRNGV